MKVTGLNIHPLKSGRAITKTSVQVRLDGFADDRRFMLVEPDGRLITQRELQTLAQVEAAPVTGGVHLRLGSEKITVPFDGLARMDVTIWDTPVNAAVAAQPVNETLSSWFGRDLKIVHMDEQAFRSTANEWPGADSPVAFADGFPILVTTMGSLADLNRSLAAIGEEPVGMDRFRTNILIDCQEPWEEDFWETIEIGGIVFDLVKPCARCIMTTQDQHTGARIGGNSLKGLAQKRMSADRRVPGMLFGWNVIPRGQGVINIADDVTVIRQRAERWPMVVRG